MKLLKKVKGFTLIEVMIVMAILGIMAAIIIPNFIAWKQKNQAKEKSTQIELVQPSEKLDKL